METKPERKPGFDLVVQHRDSKSGRVVRENPYRMIAHEGVQYFERPKHSGNLWFLNGEPAGRMEDGVIKRGAGHKEWTPPLTADQQLAQKVLNTEEENRRLKAELEQIHREKKYAPPASAGSSKADASDVFISREPKAGKKDA